jgi:zinc finger protein
MSDPTQENPDGAAFDDFFESLGKQAEATGTGQPEEETQKVVDEIESLCMNCHKNVRQSPILFETF